jgi:MarR family transcriptional regulator, organic hydroperoxide resistance regulator
MMPHLRGDGVAERKSRRRKQVIHPIDMLQVMWAMDHAMHARSKRMQRTLGITGPQRAVLRKLNEIGSIAHNALAHSVHLHPSTLTGILQRLEAAAFVTRERDEKDSRKRVITLTPGGRKLARRLPGSLEYIVAGVFSQSTLREIDCAMALLQRLTEALT